MNMQKKTYPKRNFKLQRNAELCWLWIAIFTLAGCINNGTLPVNIVFESQTCNIEAGIIPISHQKELERTLKHISSSVIGRPPPKTTSEIDFKTDQIFLISLGNKPSTGYSLSLSANLAEIDEGKINLPVAVKEPDPDKSYAQIITSPCVLLSMPKRNYKDVLIDDSNLKLIQQHNHK
ncbi:MAG: protease complex subunit PrcB family protein [Proteobacteria bacterium]|nr:protease complex subunit PrcB family protein [Pseudomonadota bacterium]MBU1716433.1 protease complex subunit PrcB family protein [Pseudomonadota bacterium]